MSTREAAEDEARDAAATSRHKLFGEGLLHDRMKDVLQTIHDKVTPQLAEFLRVQECVEHRNFHTDVARDA